MIVTPESPKADWETRTRYAEAGKIAIILVGLPATRKSFIARNLARYLLWIGVRTHVISLASLRPTIVEGRVRASFFDPSDKDALEKRTEIANKALNDLIAGFDNGGQVGILDASNTTEARRLYIHEVLSALDIKVIFLECIRDNEEELLEAHILELRMVCPEYQDVSDTDTLTDFKERIQYYKPDYVSMSDSGRQDLSYIQVIDGGSRIVVNEVHGFLPTKMLFYLMNLRHARRTIFLCQPSSDIESRTLHSMVDTSNLVVWADVTPRAAQLSSHFDINSVRIRATLSELNPGQTEGRSHEEIREAFPEEYKRHCLDPYHHRFPRAESYHDLVIRLEPIIMELERDQNSILIIADASVLRCIYAYYIEASPFLIPSLVLPHSQMIILRPEAYGCYETRLDLLNNETVVPRFVRAKLLLKFSPPFFAPLKEMSRDKSFVVPSVIFSSRVKDYILNNPHLLGNIDVHWNLIHRETGLERWQLDYYISTLQRRSLVQPIKKIPEAVEVSNRKVSLEDVYSTLECKLEEGKIRRGLQVYPDSLFCLKNFVSISQNFTQSTYISILDEVYEEMEKLLRVYLTKVIRQAAGFSQLRSSQNIFEEDPKPSCTYIDETSVSAVFTMEPWPRKDFVSEEYAKAVIDLLKDGKALINDQTGHPSSSEEETDYELDNL